MGNCRNAPAARHLPPVREVGPSASADLDVASSSDGGREHELARNRRESLSGPCFERVVHAGRPSFGSNPARVAEHLEVVRDRRLAHVAATEVARDDRSLGSQPAKDREPVRVRRSPQESDVWIDVAVHGGVPWTVPGRQQLVGATRLA